MKKRVFWLSVLLSILAGITILLLTSVNKEEQSKPISQLAFGLPDDKTVCQIEGCWDDELGLTLETEFFEKVLALSEELKAKAGSEDKLLWYIFSYDTRFDNPVELIIRLNYQVCDEETPTEYVMVISEECQIPFQTEAYLTVYLENGYPVSSNSGFRPRPLE